MVLDTLFERFCTEKVYLQNVTPATLRFYRGSWSVIKKHFPATSPDDINKNALNDLVMSLRKVGQKPKSVNTHISFLNSFLTWLHTEKHITENHKVKLLRLEQTVFRVFTEKHIKIILGYRPTDYFDARLWTMLCLLLDTGLRISELLGIRDEDVKFDQLMIIVKGKGSKERYVPFSEEMRRILWRFQKKRAAADFKGEYLFPTGTGSKVMPRNFLRDMKILCEKLGITGVRVSPHTLRHSYAIWYLVNGGDLYTLSRTLGHSSISVTQIYLRNMGFEQVQKAHQNFSPLSKRRGN